MERRLIFTTTTEMLRVPADAVVYVSADGNYSALAVIEIGQAAMTDSSAVLVAQAADIRGTSSTQIRPPS